MRNNFVYLPCLYFRPHKARKTRQVSKANSILSGTTDDYLSVSNVDSSDLEFYDLSDNEDMPSTSSTNLEIVSVMLFLIITGNICNISLAGYLRDRQEIGWGYTARIRKNSGEIRRSVYRIPRKPRIVMEDRQGPSENIR